MAFFGLHSTFCSILSVLEGHQRCCDIPVTIPYGPSEYLADERVMLGEYGQNLNADDEDGDTENDVQVVPTTKMAIPRMTFR